VIGPSMKAFDRVFFALAAAMIGPKRGIIQL
jgi:hypothetical protein